MPWKRHSKHCTYNVRQMSSGDTSGILIDGVRGFRERSRKVPLSIQSSTWVSATTPETDELYSALPSSA
ncbi:MAG TPA: hypothetical protein VND98_03785 [Solirubrobacterales bacterium]|nr:hypothetical protein [Solirubrobacterales bacterium]